MEQTAGELREYLAELMRTRQSNPGEDLLTELLNVTSRARSSEERLSQAELVGTAMLLLIAGQETTINLIGNGVLALMRNPTEFSRLRRNRALIDSAVEELVRYDTSIQVVPRVLRDEVAVGKERLPAGSEVLLVLGAANRDPCRFSNPDQLDVARTENQHVGFGGGTHYCLGAHLARLEMGAALHALIDICPRLHLPEQQLRWRPNPFLRGLEALHLKF